MTEVFSLAKRKGGVGSSTITMFLASALAKQKKKKVLIIDVDSQQTINEWFTQEQQLYQNDNALVEVEAMEAKRVQPFLERYGDDYDIIFIDIPRFTDNVKDSATVLLLSFCSGLLLPVIGSQVDVLSTLDFLHLVKEIESDKKELGFNYTVYGFINRRNRRKDNEYAENLLIESGLSMFDNSLPDIKLFTNPSLYSSILDTKEGRERFKPFFNEFLKKYKIK